MDFVGKGLNVAVGVASGYLAQKDMKATTPKIKFLDKDANKLALAAAIGGVAVEMWMPKYSNYAEPVAASGLTLLGRALYFELGVKEADRVNGISEFPASMTLVPHARGAATHFADQPGVENIRLV